MAPNTAAGFLALGLALVLLDVPARRGPWPAQVLALATVLVALLTVIGYAYSALALAGVDRVFRLGGALNATVSNRVQRLFGSGAIKVDPKFALAYLNRGLFRHARKDYDRAIADFDQAIKLAPDNASAVNARGLVYDIKGDLLTLTQEIVIVSTAGYQGRLTEAKVEIKKGHIVSEKPVQLKMPQGTLDANRMEVFDSGELIRFEGGVVMMLTPDALNKGMSQQNTPEKQANAK